jgi:hypothetical protein
MVTVPGPAIMITVELEMRRHLKCRGGHRDRDDSGPQADSDAWARPVDSECHGPGALRLGRANMKFSPWLSLGRGRSA